ncbi:hypothetical protein [Isoptericola rhizosphaerae]|uniref:hypothetical protein n=1 Tax=Isoptericola rhizosphaerae TaxID=3377837 RepID=UPI00383B49A4
MTAREPWDRAAGESRPAYAAFIAYRDAGLTRSLAKVAQELGKSSALMSRWSVRWQWVMRSDAWDAHVQRAEDDAWRGRARTMGRRHADAAAAALAKVTEALESLDPADLSPRDLVAWLDVATKVEARALGIDTAQRLEISGPAGGAVPVAVDIMTDEERRERLTVLHRETERRMAAWDADEAAVARALDLRRDDA